MTHPRNPWALQMVVRVGVILALGSGISCASQEREQALERRVDSLATTLTTVVQRLSANGGAPAPQGSATVSASGVAVDGSDSAPVTIVEFTDYQCPFCGRHFSETLPGLRTAYVKTGKVRYIVRDLPIPSLHPYALPAAEAARCVAQMAPKLFWAYHDQIFAHQQTLSRRMLIRAAGQVGLDTTRVAACMMSSSIQAAIEKDRSEAQRVGFRSTPTFVIGQTGADSIRGPVLNGAFPLSLFQQVIDSLLRPTGRAGRAGT